ncbi:MAG: efflux RND transporter periplasmic adaptor subunit [Vicinamibacteria bacterium]
MNRSIAGILLALFLGGCSPAHEEAAAKPLVTVTVAQAEQADVPISVRAPALVHPRQQASIASRITAPISALLVGKGDRVEAGAILARLDSRDLVAQREDVLAAMRQAEVVADKRRHLFEEGAIPQRDLLASETELTEAKARLEVSTAQLAFSELRSPFAGRITEQFLYPGDMAQPGTPVFTVADVGVAIARSQVAPGDASGIRQGQECAFAPGDAAAASFSGRVTVINPAVDPARRTVEAWCEIPNGDGRLLPGTFGELRIVTGYARKSVVVPVGAVQLDEGTRKGSAFVVDGQKVAHRKDVLGGVAWGGKMQILSGLEPGEVVVVEGAYALPDGTTVRIADKTAEPEKDDK